MSTEYRVQLTQSGKSSSLCAGHPARDFQGYIDKDATNSKIIRDVFRKGDMYFRWTGKQEFA